MTGDEKTLSFEDVARRLRDPELRSVAYGIARQFEEDMSSEWRVPWSDHVLVWFREIEAADVDDMARTICKLEPILEGR